MNIQRSARAWSGAAILLALLSACDRNDLPTVAGPGPAAPTFDVGTPDILVSTTADDGPGSLRQAIADVADGGVIGFEAALAGGRITLANNLRIMDKSVTIDGPADRGITLDGDGVTNIFIVTSTGGLTLRNATLTGGHATSGAIATLGTLRVENSTITGNHSVEAGSAGDGFGGGIRHISGNLTVVNTTISGNIADRRGGGIGSPSAGSGSITLIHTTVTGNTSPDEHAGGIYVSGSSTEVVLQNSIIAGNSASTKANCEFLTTNTSYLGTNLLGDTDCLPRPEDIVAADPILGPLSDNGGPTRTHALLPGSPAIETAVQACSGTPVDQRYVTRPQGSACDIGAFEFQGFVTPPLAIDAGGTVSPKSGVAFVTGTITCPAPATLTIEVRLRQTQKVARVNSVVEATARTPITCGGKRPWTVALAPATGAFKSGSGTVTATTIDAPVYLRAAEASRSVKFGWARK